MKAIKALIFALVCVFTVTAVATEAPAVLIQAFAAIGQRLPGAAEAAPVTVRFTIIDKDGKLRAGLASSNFVLTNTMSLGLDAPGKFTATVKTVAGIPGCYTMTLTPVAPNKWGGLLYRFSFIVKADATSNGLGEVMVVDLSSLQASMNNPDTAPLLGEKAQLLLKLLLPEPLLENGASD